MARDPLNAGAWDICDDPISVTGIPLTTVTVLRGGTDAPSHAYSYFLANSREARASAQVIDDFLDEHFPGF